MTRYSFIMLVILLAVPQEASSQCTDSLTVAESNFYLIKGAQAREQLALCREFRKVDQEVIAQQEKIQNKLLEEIQKRGQKYNRLKIVTYSISALFILSLIL